MTNQGFKFEFDDGKIMNIDDMRDKGLFGFAT